MFRSTKAVTVRALAMQRERKYYIQLNGKWISVHRNRYLKFWREQYRIKKLHKEMDLEAAQRCDRD